MVELFYEGGVLFMGILTLLLFIIFCLAVIVSLRLNKRKLLDPDRTDPLLTYIKSLALFALVTGILGQLIGLYSAFKSIAFMGQISPAVLADGFRVSSITTLYGFIIFLIAYLIWFSLDIWLKKLNTSD